MEEPRIEKTVLALEMELKSKISNLQQIRRRIAVMRQEFDKVHGFLGAITVRVIFQN